MTDMDLGGLKEASAERYEAMMKEAWTLRCLTYTDDSNRHVYSMREIAEKVGGCDRHDLIDHLTAWLRSRRLASEV